MDGYDGLMSEMDKVQETQEIPMSEPTRVEASVVKIEDDLPAEVKREMKQKDELNYYKKANRGKAPPAAQAAPVDLSSDAKLERTKRPADPRESRSVGVVDVAEIRLKAALKPGEGPSEGNLRRMGKWGGWHTTKNY